MGSCPPAVPFARECLNETTLNAVLALSAAADSSLHWGLNLRPPGGPQPPPLGLWDPTNARALLEYIFTRAPRQVAAFALGNEIAGSMGSDLASDAYAAAFAVLCALVDDVWGANATHKPALIGPDKNGAAAAEGAYLAAFAVAAGSNVSAVTYHEYIGVNAESVLQPSALDATAAHAAANSAAVRAADGAVEIWAGEVGPHTGDGANSSFASCSNNRLK